MTNKIKIAVAIGTTLTLGVVGVLVFNKINKSNESKRLLAETSDSEADAPVVPTENSGSGLTPFDRFKANGLKKQTVTKVSMNNN